MGLYAFLVAKKKVRMNNVLFFQNKKIITPKTKLSKNDDGSITVTYIDTFKYPTNEFPNNDFEFELDYPIFSKTYDLKNMFPVESTLTPDPRKVTNPHKTIQDYFPTMRFEFTDPSVKEPTFSIIDRVMKNGKFVNQRRTQILTEENDDDQIGIQKVDKKAENLTPEENESIRRLCDLGYEDDFVYAVYFHVGKNEELAARFLKQFLG
ncbi:hypothetical protein TRFO_26831 [Tritrichomonas foetus]|uniref:UV excision repair protein RAD23 n=1 Tax=Tritrichomonas foetus TaxID=1144522 RepID=A0A1J4K3C1_9EUKA|nr:hypothetical protein TRFO_26831 [Tritrichomonas foetus]|eukprot:OHT05474.1 hypothetical protein TRFO_26831 [Tritrichomonas foetus]